MRKSELRKDKAELENNIRLARSQIKELNIQILRWDGALAYINDNLEEAQDDRGTPSVKG